MTTSIPAPTPAPDTHLVESTDDGNPFARAIVGAVVAGLASAIAALQNGYGIEPAEWVAIIISFLVAGGAVWAIPTKREGVGRYGKAITAALVTALGVLGTGLADDGYLNQTEWLMAITALLSALLVASTPEIPAGVVTAPGVVTPPGVTTGPYPHPPSPNFPTGPTGPTTPAVG